jgi:hypothetical protein
MGSRTSSQSRTTSPTRVPCAHLARMVTHTPNRATEGGRPEKDRKSTDTKTLKSPEVDQIEINRSHDTPSFLKFFLKKLDETPSFLNGF